jgi:stage II sporulation protein D
MRVPIAVAAVLCLAGCCYYTPRAAVRPAPRRRQVSAGEPLVRVRLTAGSSVLLSSKQGLTLAAVSSRQSVEANKPIQVSCEGRFVLAACGDAPLRTTDTLTVTPGADGFIRVDDRSYRGRLLLFRSGDGDLVVVNVLGLEEYLFGVVPCEIGPANARTVEAVKAQAVAARSYTMARLGRRQGLGHDLFDSYLRDQEYRGLERETELSRQAVLATRGEVLEYHGDVCEALYHGNCGGVTANGFRPYLKSVRDTPGHRRGQKAYCSDKPNFSWRADFRKESLDAVVSRLSGKKCLVRRCRLEADRRSGRVRYLHLATDRGSVRLSGSDFRMAMALKSTSFSMAIRGATVHFAGRGSGHGSGMCQDGAVGMAKGGASYKQILLHYYSGVSLDKRY